MHINIYIYFFFYNTFFLRYLDVENSELKEDFYNLFRYTLHQDKIW